MMKGAIYVLFGVVGIASSASAVTTVFTDRAAWEAAATGTIATEDFNSLSPIVLPANGTTPAGLISVRTVNAAAFNQIAVGTHGRNVNGTTFLRISPDTEVEIVTIIFPHPVTAWGADWNEQESADDIHVTFADIVGQPIFDLTGSHSGFVGFVTDEAFTEVHFTDPFVSFADAGFDDVSFNLVVNTYTDRAAWEAAVAGFTEETFDSFTKDQSFNNGATVDVGAFSLTGFGDAQSLDEIWNRIDATPFSPSRPSPNGTTNIVARVCDSAFVGCLHGFDITFDAPIAAWGADFGFTGSSFRVNADGAVVGLAQSDGFFGFVVKTGTITTVTIDTPTEFGGANTNMDNFVFADSAVAGPTCEDVRSFRSKCTNKVKARVRMNDTSHDGEQVIISVDGVKANVTIVNGSVRYTTPATPGAHTVSLDEPAGCFEPIVVACPSR